MKLSELVGCLKDKTLINFKDVDVTGISFNSQTTQTGDIFVCLNGEHTDGHDFASAAIDRGAVALVVERQLDIPGIPQVLVDSSRHNLADIADRFYGGPSKNINLIGVTGTNGKTTITHLVQKILEDGGQKCALIGTMGYKLSSDGAYNDTGNTTPLAPQLQSVFKMVKDNEHIDNVVMEVSSHALDQNRTGKCAFNGAIFTNLTQDHLDYHITMENYFNAKAKLFRQIEQGGFAVINVDDEYGQRLLSIIPSDVRTLTYGIKNHADLMATDIVFTNDGIRFTLITKNVKQSVRLHMNGLFNVYNVLAALGASLAMGINIQDAIKTLENIGGVPGRFQVVNKKPLVIIDYAHTPDGLENVLKTAKEIVPANGKLVCVFGCGGNRDTTKRPKMGAIAERLADVIVITSDNPRNENPQKIIDDIVAGLSPNTDKRVVIEPDRHRAIELLKGIANEDDVVLVAGKGHENYQIIGDNKIHFDDREEVEKVFGIR